MRLPDSHILSKEEESHLWQSFSQDKTTEIRDRLFLSYAIFARHIAGSLFAARQIKDFEFDDFLQFAHVGLLESIDRFDPTLQVPFRAYASLRIRGSILSGVEKLSEKQQQIAAQTRLRRERFDSVCSSTEKTAQDTFSHLVDTAIGLAIAFMLDGSGMYCDEEVAENEDVYKAVEFKQLQHILKSLVSKLSEQEKTVITYHYFHGFLFEQIAELLGVTKGRVSQIHRRAIEHIRADYKNQADCKLRL